MPGDTDKSISVQIFDAFPSLQRLHASLLLLSTADRLMPETEALLSNRIVGDVANSRRCLKNCFTHAHEKLHEYMSKHAEFMRQCQILHPQNRVGANTALSNYSSLFTGAEYTTLSDPTNAEWQMYVDMPVECASESFNVLNW